MNGVIALKKARDYTDSVANSLGSLKGAPCTVKNVTTVDGQTTVILEWEGANGTKETSQFVVFDGDSAYEIAKKNGFQGTEVEWLESLKMDIDELESVVSAEVAEQLGTTVEDTVDEKIEDNLATNDDIDGFTW